MGTCDGNTTLSSRAAFWAIFSACAITTKGSDKNRALRRSRVASMVSYLESGLVIFFWASRTFAEDPFLFPFSRFPPRVLYHIRISCLYFSGVHVSSGPFGCWFCHPVATVSIYLFAFAPAFHNAHGERFGVYLTGQPPPSCPYTIAERVA